MEPLEMNEKIKNLKDMIQTFVWARSSGEPLVADRRKIDGFIFPAGTQW
jgi:hypothetical protein